MLSKQRLSKLLSDTLDECGYSEKRVRERIWMKGKCSTAKMVSTKDICTEKLDKFLVGSQREGISLEGESDSDWMQVNTSVLCADKTRNIIKDRDGKIIFRLERKKAPAGYVYLRYISQDKNQHPYFEKLKHALVDSEKGTFLSSAKYMNINEDVFHGSEGYIGRNTIYKEKNGPAIQKVVKTNFVEEFILGSYDVCRDIDLVRGFQCFCPSVLNKWLHRRRFSSWPSQETRDKVATLPYYVVPVGHAGSPDEHLQWRFSFTMAEICLVQSFNETQRKMLILLRYIARHILKIIAPDITSYTMKNVAFWMVEKTQADKFLPDQLFDRVIDSIEYLLECVKRKKLQTYLIPEKNLFQEKLRGKQRKRLIKELELLRDNGQMLLTNFFLCQNVENEYPETVRFLVNVSFYNLYDKVETLNAFTFSPTQLAQFFTFHFYCKSRLLVLIYTILLVTLQRISMFGIKAVTDPTSIDPLEMIKEPQETWCWYRVIARNKDGTKLLLRVGRCGWFCNKVLQTLADFSLLI